jgi:hypothetical protein
MLGSSLVISMAQVNGDPKYKSYRDSNCLQKPVEELLKASGVDLCNGGGLEELEQFQEYLSDYKIVVFEGLYPDRIMFSGNSVSDKKLYLLYDSDSGHYNVITNIKAAMAKRCICNACDTLYDNTHKCDKACYLCTATPPCTKDQKKYCGTCNRWFLSEKCFQNLTQSERQASLSVETSMSTFGSKYECFKKFCNICNKKQSSGHFCYVAPLKTSKLSDKFMYVFFDTEYTRPCKV